MAPGLFCTTDFVSMLNTEIYPLSLIAAILGAMVIGIIYAVSQSLSSPRLSVWAKTEAIQLGISASFVIILISMINSFCSFTTSDLGLLTNETIARPAVAIYTGAEAYLLEAANYSHVALLTTRYYLGMINTQEMYSTWQCPIWCFFSLGGTGESQSPEAGASYLSSGFMLLLNSSTMAFFSAFMHIFFLKYVGSGLFLFLFPIAIVMRSLPFMRGFGSVILTVIFVLYVVYPSILAVYYATLPISVPQAPDESDLSPSANWLTGGNYSGKRVTATNLVDTAKLVVQTFFYSVFLPTAAMLGAAASAFYAARLMGEEIDLSRLTQMV